MRFPTWTMGRMAALVLACAFSAVCQASQTTYQWVGPCTSICTGNATATLVLQNYTPGATITASNFVSFSFTETAGSFSIPPGPLDQIAGSLPASLPGNASVVVQSGINELITGSFFSNSNPGAWCGGVNCESTSVQPFAAQGVSGTWSVATGAPPPPPPPPTTPAPATILLCLMGLAAMGGALLRRRASGAV